MSFNIALSGIKAVNNQLERISDNIANGGTAGFKSSRANFATMVAGNQPNGVYIGSTSQSIGVGGNLFHTGRTLDAAIQGKGFFVVKDADGSELYTRFGAFQKDADGYMTDVYGRRLQGWTDTGAFGDIQVGSGSVPAKASDTLEYVGNLKGDWKAPDANVDFSKDNKASYNESVTTTVHDSLGRAHTVTQYFRQDPAPANSVSVFYAMDGETLADASGAPILNKLEFDADGKLTSPSGAISLDLGTPVPAAELTVALNYAGTTHSGSSATTTTINRSNGYEPGTLSDTTLDEKGQIIAQYSNGQKAVVGTLALATFANADGLSAVNNTSWRSTSLSGNALYARPGSGMAGGVVPTYREGSNVDVTQELVELMAAQRNYQANSKVVSTENQLMQALLQAL
ncbi:flagellar hook protein FlgE [Pandoraea pulmonicola]|uniref:Flagellar hook protein FlgE n=1 Tax=Pandoraea pulmonicola TaxID=93221 RepID=A0AAJ4ZB60_PANPU|nr:flagellar hook-basal body complex protein [Pandoraea pulmonicola]AJC21227.1 flagellar biosynthesis protein FlgE [Pandoraea pulmonicola]SUA90087.1 Flagellar hook protein flgE [Pandoraea pulmonicola]